MTEPDLVQLYVVRRSFRSVGNFYQAGTILTDEDLKEIRYAKIKISEGKIRRWPTEELDQQNMIDYFKHRLGIDLEEKFEARASEGSDVAESDLQDNEPTPPGTDTEDAKQPEAPKVEEPKKEEEKPVVKPAAAPASKTQPTTTKHAQPSATKPKA
ncbi:hypothetical protein D3C76_574880 [compost metagenome]